jgi:hypothetical protein
MYGLEALPDLVSNKWFIRDEALEKRLGKVIFEHSSGGIAVRYNSWNGFRVDQMAANCGALVISNIEAGDVTAIDFIAKNVASRMGDKVMFLSATGNRAREFERIGWQMGLFTWSGRGNGGKMGYLFRELKEEERQFVAWREMRRDDDGRLLDRYGNSDYEDDDEDEEYHDPVDHGDINEYYRCRNDNCQGIPDEYDPYVELDDGDYDL